MVPGAGAKTGAHPVAAGILKGIRYGLLDGSYLDVCRRAVDSILQEVDDDGTVLKVSAGTAIGATISSRMLQRHS